jgi:predicted GIY-YIG superfamily endonuclease
VEESGRVSSPKSGSCEQIGALQAGIKAQENFSAKRRTQATAWTWRRRFVNLSSHELNHSELSVLNKGLNFAISPSSIPFDNLICCIEDSIKTLTDEDKDQVRQDCAVILRNAKPPKSNISKEERLAIKNLRNNTNLIILKADKGGATVIMNKEDYITKMNEHLSCGSYIKIPKNPIKKIIKEVKKTINSSNLDEKTKKRLLPTNEITPRIYGLPKIHKEGIPLRPIVNTIGSPTYELAKYVAKILGPLVGHTDSFIKDSKDFINTIKNEILKPNDTLISFDVVSLFTKIPLNEAILLIQEVADPVTTKLAEVCLRSTFFSYQGEFYEQTSGVAMGSPLSPIVANLYMESFEKKAIDSYPLKPLRWKRYVDDTNVLWPHGEEELNKFFHHINNLSKDIKFTMEREVNDTIPFLDILINRKEDGKLGHSVYRKKTHTENYLHASSHHHPNQKLGILNTLSTRAIRISDKEHLEQEKNHLHKVFKNIGYKEKEIENAIRKALEKENNKPQQKNNQTPSLTAYLPYIQGVTDKIAKILNKKEIKTSFKPLNTIKQNMRSVKDKLDQHNFKGVYRIDCSCGKCYIGETGRSFNTRIKEHSADIKNERARTSALAEHSLKTKHHIRLEDTRILAKEDHLLKRRIREAIEIIKNPDNLNRDNGLEISDSWIPLIRERKHY